MRVAGDVSPIESVGIDGKIEVIPRWPKWQIPLDLREDGRWCQPLQPALTVCGRRRYFQQQNQSTSKDLCPG